MRLVLFGIGRFYMMRKRFLEHFSIGDKIIAFIDNRATTPFSFDGVTVYHPSRIHELVFDIILIMSGSLREMREQLLELGVDGTKICFWEEYRAMKSHGKVQIYTNNILMLGKKKILLISTDLNYNGGSIAVVYAAKCLMKRGFAVCVAAPKGDTSFINEMVRDGLNIVAVPSLPYVGTEELFWINQFDVVLVNVFQMIRCAVEIGKVKPVLWWIHEPSATYSSIYENIRYCFKAYDSVRMMQGISIYAVSEIAKRNFERYYPKTIRNVLPYGIPDEMGGEIHNRGGHHIFVFAIIGSVIELKAQDLFLEAVSLLPTQKRMGAEFWIIGSCGTDSYGLKIKRMAENIPEVKCFGLLTRKQMRKIFPRIDVVVCPSLEDSLPIVVTEGMMYSKTCIVTDEVGQAQFIIDGENGFICKAGDVRSLATKMEWILENRDKVDQIGKNGRDVYEKAFSMFAFGLRLEKALKKTEEEFSCYASKTLSPVDEQTQS